MSRFQDQLAAWRKGGRSRTAPSGELEDAALRTQSSMLDRLFQRHSVSSNGSVDVREALFPDFDAMKARVQDVLNKPQFSVLNYYKDKGYAQAIARDPMFETVTLGVITLNALWLWYDTDTNTANLWLEADLQYRIAENFFCAYFFVEWMIRFLAFRRKRDGCRDSWFLFDSALCLLTVGETWVMAIAYVCLGGDSNLGSSQGLRLARLLRLARMARMARVMRAMPELMILIKGMQAALRSVLFTLSLLLLVMYVFAVFFTQLMFGCESGAVYFQTVIISMRSLLVYGVLLDNIGDLVVDVGKDSWPAVLIFIFFMFLTAFTVMNMLIGVLCEVVCVVAAVEREEIACSNAREKLHSIVEEMDDNGDEEISKEEFKKLLEIPAAVQAFKEVGVDVIGVVDLADFIFEAEEGEDKVLSFTDFMDLVLSLRGSKGATVKDLVNIQKYVRTLHNEQHSQLQEAQKRLNSIEDLLLVLTKGEKPHRRTTRHKNTTQSNSSRKSKAATKKLRRSSTSSRDSQGSNKSERGDPSNSEVAGCGRHIATAGDVEAAPSNGGSASARVRPSDEALGLTSGSCKQSLFGQPHRYLNIGVSKCSTRDSASPTQGAAAEVVAVTPCSTEDSDAELDASTRTANASNAGVDASARSSEDAVAQQCLRVEEALTNGLSELEQILGRLPASKSRAQEAMAAASGPEQQPSIPGAAELDSPGSREVPSGEMRRLHSGLRSLGHALSVGLQEFRTLPIGGKASALSSGLPASRSMESVCPKPTRPP